MPRPSPSFAIAALFAAAQVAAAPPTVERERELVRFVRQECGFCHGLRLTGGLGSPLTAESLKDKDFDGLVATILYGRPGTAMPGWQPHLSEEEARWIVRSLKKGFPE